MEYFISDLHFNLKNATDEGRNFDNRPFKTVKEMNDVLINNWNQAVTKNDHIFVLGDLCWKGGDDAVRIVRNLKGHIHLITGNHDKCQNPDYMKLFAEIVPYKEIKVEIDDELISVVLSHYPIMFYNGMHKGAILLYGHVHDTVEETLFQQVCNQLNHMGKQNQMEIRTCAYNVGCMMPYIDFTPRTLKEIIDGNKKSVAFTAQQQIILPSAI